MDDTNTLTYILRTQSNEYYCGKTININDRLQTHKLSRKGWFCSASRRNFKLLYLFTGNYEKTIKRAGIKLIVNLLNNIKMKG